MEPTFGRAERLNGETLGREKSECVKVDQKNSGEGGRERRTMCGLPPGTRGQGPRSRTGEKRQLQRKGEQRPCQWLEGRGRMWTGNPVKGKEKDTTGQVGSVGRVAC